jgi:hypothetical protein
MNLHVLHKISFVHPGTLSSLWPRRKRRRCCTTCRAIIRRAAIRCDYCGQRSLTHWHRLLLGATILLISFLLLSLLNSLNV